MNLAIRGIQMVWQCHVIVALLAAVGTEPPTGRVVASRTMRLDGTFSRPMSGFVVIRQPDVSALHEQPGEASPNPV